MSVRLYVGNLPKESVEREKLQALFADEGDTITTKVIKDRKTGKCRGFAFVTVPSDELADQFIEKYNGQSFMENPIKIEKALPRSKGGKEEGEEAEGTEASVETAAKNARLNGVAIMPRKLPAMVTLYSQIPVGLMNWLNSRKC